MAITREQLAADLRPMGIREGEALIVHASVKSVGPTDDGPETIIRALLDVIGGPSGPGTLMLPTFTKPQPDRTYDPQTTPCWTGLLPETFRQMPGVLRSLHPTHSVAVAGAHAVEWIEGHETRGGLSVDSPMHRAAQAGAKVLMIGCTMASCSIVHVSEAITGAAYLGRVIYPGYEAPFTIAVPDGRRIVFEAKNVPTCSNNFHVVGEALEAARRLARPRLGEATCLLFTANDAIDAAKELLAKDPAALLCSKPKCPVCPPARELIASQG